MHPPPPGPPGWGPQPYQPIYAPPPPPPKRPPVVLVVVAAVVTLFAFCCLSGALRDRGAAPSAAPSQASPQATPTTTATPEPPQEEAFADDPAATQQLMAYYRDFCVPGRHRRDPPRCPDWEMMIRSASVARSASGRYRAEVSTLIPSRDPLGENLATTICAQTMAGLPGGAIANISGTVRVKMSDGNTIAHNAFGRCTAGLF